MPKSRARRKFREDHSPSKQTDSDNSRPQTPSLSRCNGMYASKLKSTICPGQQTNIHFTSTILHRVLTLSLAAKEYKNILSFLLAAQRSKVKLAPSKTNCVNRLNLRNRASQDKTKILYFMIVGSFFLKISY